MLHDVLPPPPRKSPKVFKAETLTLDLGLAEGPKWKSPAVAGLSLLSDLSVSGVSRVWAHCGSNPNTATPFWVPIYTLPLTIIGVMNLFPFPKLSRPLGAWLLL